MNEVFSYIFKNLSDNNLLMRNICKVVNNQRKAILWTNLCMLGLCVTTTLKNIEDSKRDKQIEELKREIEELKQKGE